MKIWKYHAISMYTAGCVARVLVEVIYYMEGQKFSAPASCFFYGAQRSQRYSHRSWFLQGSRRVYPSNSRCLQQYSSLAGRRWSRPSKWSDLGPLQLIACSEHFGTRRSVFCHDSNTVSALISVGFGLRFLLRTLLVSMFAQTRRRQFHLKMMRRQIHWVSDVWMFVAWQGVHQIETPFRSIPICLWWVFTTMTTVGAMLADWCHDDVNDVITLHLHQFFWAREAIVAACQSSLDPKMMGDWLTCN